MIVLCYLPSRSLAQIHRAFPPPHCVSSARTWEELLLRVRERRCDVAVIDPCTDGDQVAVHRVEVLSALTPNPPGIAVVAYVSVTAAALRAVHGLVRLGASEIIIRGVDDSTTGLEAAIHRALAASVAAGAVSYIGSPFRALPAPVASALELMFRRPEKLRSVTDLATAARMSRRSLDRCLARAGLSPARILLACARANAAFHMLAGGSLRRAQAASLLGYPSSRSLSRELQAVTGFPASAIPAGLSRDVFAAKLSERLLRSGSASAAVPAPY